MSPIKKLTAQVNQSFSFTSEELDHIDFLPLDDQHFHILQDARSYKAKLIKADYKKKIFLIRVNGNNYSIQLSDKYDQLVEELGLNVALSHTALDIKAPMPGLVLEVLVKEGQEVEEGTPILILEAMKMENILKAAAAGNIEKIEVIKGATVEKGQLLVKVL